MANSDQLEELKEQLTIELTNTLNAQMGAKNQEIDDELNRIRQTLQTENSPEQRGVEDGMDIILNQHMRDITRETRPQMSSAGLEINNKHFKDLSNHELHQIKKIHEKDHSLKPKTILDESMGDIMNKLVNFLTFSFDGYTKAYYAAEVMENVYDDEKSMYQNIKVHLIAIILFMREDQNILYIGILLVFLSMIIYLVNITTS